MITKLHWHGGRAPPNQTQSFTETEMSFWRNFRHWLHRKITTFFGAASDDILLKWHFRFSVSVMIKARRLKFEHISGMHEISYSGDWLYTKGPLLLTWINFNPSMISNHMPCKVCDEITYPFPVFNGATDGVWESIRNFIPHLIMDLITYPCWDLSYSDLVKRAQVT